MRSYYVEKVLDILSEYDIWNWEVDDDGTNIIINDIYKLDCLEGKYYCIVDTSLEEENELCYSTTLRETLRLFVTFAQVDFSN